MNSVARMLENAGQRFAEEPALEDSQECMTYGQLRAAARRVAAGLLQQGIRREQPIAVFLPKGVRCVVSFYGALYCGVAYSPLDYTSPEDRILKTLKNLQPAAIITDAESRQRLAALENADCVFLDYETLVSVQGDEAMVDECLSRTVDTDPAYIMYTSGSTGVPKGVVIPHRGVLDYAAWIAETYSITQETILGLQSGFHFDNSVFDLYASVLVGAKVQIIPEILFMYPSKLMEYVKEKRVSCIFWVPTVMISVANSGVLETLELPDLKTIVFAGEVMPNKHLNIWRKHLPGRVYSNLYGPTEITVDCTCYMVDRDFDDSDPLPIGYERHNMRVVILNDDETEAAPGQTGELCVIGSQLALGYWNNPEETARAFVANPLNKAFHEEMYRTGDLAYKCEDGLIMYVGRKDSQIKLRGNRIEMGDIENAARTISGVTNACAVFDAPHEQIILFVETKEKLNKRMVNLELGKRIPKYMLPGKVICLEAFPLNANRKIDRVALRKTMEGGA